MINFENNDSNSSNANSNYDNLSLVLKTAHREAAMKALREHGVAINEWDQIAELYTDTVNMSDIILGDVTYNGAVESAPDGLLGSPKFIVLSSCTPLTNVLNVLAKQSLTKSEYLIADVDSPAKIIEVSLIDSTGLQTNPAGFGLIYLTPDSPPAAAHCTDLEYVTAQTGIKPDDIRILSHTINTFGPESVEYLSRPMCLAVIRAVFNGNPTSELSYEG